jgi:hypothetical protein
MLNKVGYIILSMLLILSTAGVVISKHYCQDKLVAVSVNYQVKDCCDGPKGECCRNENVLVNLEVDFSIPVIDELSICEIDLFGSGYIEFSCEQVECHRPSYLLVDSSPPPGTQLFLAKIQSYLL